MVKDKELEDPEQSRPTVYVLAGANGAGKTTFATQFLPKFVKCREFLNADLIAAGLSPFAAETQNVHAGRLLLKRIDELSKERANFGFETTLSGRTYVKLLSRMKANGYRIVLFFLWLPEIEMALTRVSNRVSQGGHNVPPEDIRRRYVLGLRNLFQLYCPILDVWWLYDASNLPPKTIAWQENGELTVKLKGLFNRIKKEAEQT